MSFTIDSIASLENAEIVIRDALLPADRIVYDGLHQLATFELRGLDKRNAIIDKEIWETGRNEMSCHMWTLKFHFASEVGLKRSASCNRSECFSVGGLTWNKTDASGSGCIRIDTYDGLTVHIQVAKLSGELIEVE